MEIYSYPNTHFHQKKDLKILKSKNTVYFCWTVYISNLAQTSMKLLIIFGSQLFVYVMKKF